MEICGAVYFGVAIVLDRRFWQLWSQEECKLWHNIKFIRCFHSEIFLFGPNFAFLVLCLSLCGPWTWFSWGMFASGAARLPKCALTVRVAIHLYTNLFSVFADCVSGWQPALHFGAQLHVSRHVEVPKGSEFNGRVHKNGILRSHFGHDSIHPKPTKVGAVFGGTLVFYRASIWKTSKCWKSVHCRHHEHPRKFILFLVCTYGFGKSAERIVVRGDRCAVGVRGVLRQNSHSDERLLPHRWLVPGVENKMKLKFCSHAVQYLFWSSMFSHFYLAGMQIEDFFASLCLYPLVAYQMDHHMQENTPAPAAPPDRDNGIPMNNVPHRDWGRSFGVFQRFSLETLILWEEGILYKWIRLTMRRFAEATASANQFWSHETWKVWTDFLKWNACWNNFVIVLNFLFLILRYKMKWKWPQTPDAKMTEPGSCQNGLLLVNTAPRSSKPLQGDANVKSKLRKCLMAFIKKTTKWQNSQTNKDGQKDLECVSGFWMMKSKIDTNCLCFKEIFSWLANFWALMTHKRSHYRNK